VDPHWEFVIAGYGLTWLALVAYFLSLAARTPRGPTRGGGGDGRA